MVVVVRFLRARQGGRLNVSGDHSAAPAGAKAGG